MTFLSDGMTIEAGIILAALGIFFWGLGSFFKGLARLSHTEKKEKK